MAWITSSTGVARLSLRLFSISSRARSCPGSSGMTRPSKGHRYLVMAGSSPAMTRKLDRVPASKTASLRLEYGEALVRVEDVALHVRCFGRPPPELVHRADETHPVEDLLLPAVLDRAQRPLAPGRIIGGLQRVIERAVGFNVGVEQVMLRRQKGVRPAG